MLHNMIGFFKPTSSHRTNTIILNVNVLFLLLSAAGASASSSYQALDQYDVGYSEQETGPARFEIHYSGEWKQSHETVGKYVLFRSAELAEEMGFPFFVIESMTLFDEPEIRIVKTCSEIRVLSDTTVPASSVSVRYLGREDGQGPGLFSTQQVRKMAFLLLEDDQHFPLSSFLEERGVQLSNSFDNKS